MHTDTRRFHQPFIVITNILNDGSWSPLHELVPETPLRHGHAISIDMAFSATLANSRKLLSDEQHCQILNLFSRAGLSMDHPQFDNDILDKGTQAILKTRDGLLRAAVPSPLGQCKFLNDVSLEEMQTALARHKKICATYPRNGEGLEAYVDASDTGYSDGNVQEVEALEKAAEKAGELNGTTISGGKVPNGISTNGVKEKLAKEGEKAAGLTNGVNGFVNGSRA